MKTKKIIEIGVISFITGLTSIIGLYYFTQTTNISTIVPTKKQKDFKVVTDYKTPNVLKGKNSVEGIVLHHTASRNAKNAIGGLCDAKRKYKTSCNVVIDRDGTRYVLAQPTARTMHAGHSMLNGKENCNKFTIGIEFQGNTCVWPLSDEQIYSAIEYIVPLMNKYNIPLENIVSHKQVRNEWLTAHMLDRKKKVPAKVDISDKEYNRFIAALKKELDKQNNLAKITE